MSHAKKPIIVGGIGEINFGKQFRQGNRVYSAKGIAMCLTSKPLGNLGGYSYLYLVEVEDENPICGGGIKKSQEKLT